MTEYVLVPIEPTPEMLMAAGRAVHNATYWLAAAPVRATGGELREKWKRLDFGRFGGMVDFDVGGVTLRLHYGEACIVDGILARFIADLAALNPAVAPAGADAGQAEYDAAILASMERLLRQNEWGFAGRWDEVVRQLLARLRTLESALNAAPQDGEADQLVVGDRATKWATVAALLESLGQPGMASSARGFAIIEEAARG